MSDITKMEYPAFLKLPILMKGKDGEDKIGELRVNPMMISSYYGGYNSGDKDREITMIYVSGQSYMIDMKMSEVNEMMENIERGMSIKDHE